VGKDPIGQGPGSGTVGGEREELLKMRMERWVINLGPDGKGSGKYGEEFGLSLKFMIF
jgi:hypothetical protein